VKITPGEPLIKSVRIKGSLEDFILQVIPDIHDALSDSTKWRQNTVTRKLRGKNRQINFYFLSGEQAWNLQACFSSSVSGRVTIELASIGINRF
jgi:hypothetical protein